MKLLAAGGVEEICLTARGQGIYPAALAALYCQDCRVKVKFPDPPCNLGDLMDKDVVPFPHSGLITGFLKYTDFDEIRDHLNMRE